jgi:hypothetical protein
MSFSTTCEWSDMLHGSDEDSWPSPFQDQDKDEWTFSDEKHKNIQEWHPFNPHQYETVFGLSHLVKDSPTVTTKNQGERKFDFCHAKNRPSDTSLFDENEAPLILLPPQYFTQERSVSPSCKSHQGSSLSISIEAKRLEEITLNSCKGQEIPQGGILNGRKSIHGRYLDYFDREKVESIETVQQKALSWDTKLKNAREQQLKFNLQRPFHQEVRIRDTKKDCNLSYQEPETEKKEDSMNNPKTVVDERLLKLNSFNMYQNDGKTKNDVVTNENLVGKHSSVDLRQNTLRSNGGRTLKDVINVASLDISTSCAEKKVTDKRLWLENVFKPEKTTQGSSNKHVVSVIRPNDSHTDKIHDACHSKSLVQRRRKELEKKVQEEKSNVITKVEWHQKNGKYKKKLIILKKDEDIYG